MRLHYTLPKCVAVKSIAIEVFQLFTTQWGCNPSGVIITVVKLKYDFIMTEATLCST